VHLVISTTGGGSGVHLDISTTGGSRGGHLVISTTGGSRGGHLVISTTGGASGGLLVGTRGSFNRNSSNVSWQFCNTYNLLATYVVSQQKDQKLTTQTLFESCVALRTQLKKFTGSFLRSMKRRTARLAGAFDIIMQRGCGRTCVLHLTVGI
jgi:hypothetical protein